MSERSQDWLNQAKRDLENAKWEVVGKYYEWAAFSCQQAAEKAVKAVYYKLGGDAWGHSVANLLEGLHDKANLDESLIDAGRNLDKFYIPARYPNGWDTGIPMNYYTKEDAENAVACAEKIIRFCDSILAG